MKGWFQKRSEPSSEPANRRRPISRGDAARRSPVFSYYAQRPSGGPNLGRGTDHIPETRTPLKLRLMENRLMRGIMVAGVIVLGGYMVSLDGEPHVKSQRNGGSAYFLQDDTVYQQTVRKTLDRSVWSATKLTVHSAAIQDDLLRNYPEIAEVQIDKPLLSRQLQVLVRPQQPSLILTTADRQAFLLDSNGRALVSVSQIDDMGELSVPTLHDASNLSVVAGSQALPVPVIRFVRSVTDLLEQKNIEVSSLTLPPSASELHAAVSGRPYYVKFNLQNDARQQVGTFLAVKARLERDKAPPVSYIDVRIPGRAYIK